jgi:hypothetical protein
MWMIMVHLSMLQSAGRNQERRRVHCGTHVLSAAMALSGVAKNLVSSLARRLRLLVSSSSSRLAEDPGMSLPIRSLDVEAATFTLCPRALAV